MSEPKEMSKLEIAKKLKTGKSFVIHNKREQTRVLTIAPYLGIQIVTRSLGNTPGWVVSFVK
jgi:hypothetical protein